MIKFCERFIKALKVAKLLDQAWHATALHDVTQAEGCFKKIELYTTNLSAEHQIMKAYIKFNASKYKEAGLLFDDVWLKIDDDLGLSDEEKLYFKGYVLCPSKITLDVLKYENSDEGLYQNIKFFDLSDIKLDKVSKKWKRHFPIRDHPDWDKYGV